MMTANTKLTQTGGECTHSPEEQAPNLFSVQDESIMNLDICDLAKYKMYQWLRETEHCTNSLERTDLKSSQLERMRLETVIFFFVYLFLSHNKK